MKTTLRLFAAITLTLLLSVQSTVAGQFETELLVLINRYRSSHRLKALVSSPLYNDLAREHSQAMQEQQRMSHDGADDRFRQAAADSARSCVENVGWNHETPQSLFNGWRNSAGHNRNMLNREINRAGINKTGAYITFFACYRSL
jgi:uncharacterized protein YkwD